MNVLVLGPVGVGPATGGGDDGNGFLTPTSNILRAVMAALALAGSGGLSAGELFETVWGSRDARSMRLHADGKHSPVATVAARGHERRRVR